MDIVISGTKFGWGYFTDKQPSGLFDIGTGAGIKAITQQAYAINYKDKNCIFTKYRIIKDVRGDKRIGFVAFSLFLPFDKKLSGKAIKSILDRVESEYCQIAIRDGRNLEDVKENFGFIDTILAEYEKDISSNSSVVIEDMQSGTTDAAVVYFPYIYTDIQTQKETKFELEDIFDAPFQEEYMPYRQILFISNDLELKDENPLIALQHSENYLTGKVDLKNECYYLNKFNSSKGIKIYANGHLRSDKRGENLIRAKWRVEIKYSKDDRCYDPINEHGTLSDTTSEIYKYLEIKGNQIILKYDAFNNPKKKTKPVVFKITDSKGGDIEDVEITCKNNNYQPAKTVTNNQIVFSGEELKDTWSAIARKGDFSGKTEFTPEKTNESDPIIIIVEKRTIITINVKDEEGENLFDFEVWTKLTNGYQLRNTIDFVDEQIMDTYHVTVRKRGYEEKNIRDFKPDKQISIDVILKKEQKTTQTPSVQNLHKYKTEKQKSFTVKAKTFFSKPAAIAASIVSALVLGVGIWALCYFLGNDKQPEKNTLNKWNIEMYVEGDSLFLDILNDYKENWKLQEQNFVTKSGGGIFGGEEKVDYSKWYSDWQPAYDSIERAIAKRNLVNTKNFAELKNLSYSHVQQSFKDAIGKIDCTKYAKVGTQLDDVSALTLTQIAGRINEILKTKEPEKKEQPQEPKKENPQHARLEQPKEPPMQQEPKPATRPTQQTPATTDNTSKIIQYIKGSELDEVKLNEYKNTQGINQNLKNSIQLCLDFWALDGSGSGKKTKTYWNFRNQVDADNNFNNSKLKAFLDKMCNENNPSYSKMDKKKGLK